MTTTSVIDIKAAFIYQASDFNPDKERPTKTEVSNVTEKILKNLVNIPNLEGIAGDFGYAIIYATQAEWFDVELKRINNLRQAAAVEAQIKANADLVALGQPPDAPLVVLIPAVHSECEPFPVIENPGPFTINPSDTEKQITIKKLINAQDLALYSKYASIEAAVCLLLREVFSPTLFSDLNSSISPVYNRISAREMRAHLETKYDKLLPKHIAKVMVDFNSNPDTARPMEAYFERQQMCIDQLKDTSEPISDATKKRTARGHFLSIPYLQQAVIDRQSRVNSRKIHGIKLENSSLRRTYNIRTNKKVLVQPELQIQL